MSSPPSRLPRPTFADQAEYAASLGDVEYWAPYVAEALARHELPCAAPEIGSVGSFPTIQVGRYVVKLFGGHRFGTECHAAERSIQRLLLGHPEIPAPRLVAEGRLFDGGTPDAASCSRMAGPGRT